MNILITRQPNQSIEFINQLSRKGLFPFLLPMIETLPVHFISDNKDYDYVVFPSINSVRYFIEHFNKYNFNKIIAIGESTAEYLKQFDIIPDLVPYEFSSEGLIQELKDKNLSGKTFLTVGPKKRSKILNNFLLSKQAFVDELVIYETKPVIYEKNKIDIFLENNKIDVVTFASPSAAESFFTQVVNLPYNIRFVSIGKVTYEYLKEKNIDSIYPSKYTVTEMVNLISLM